jgi:hypothetical protein
MIQINVGLGTSPGLDDLVSLTTVNVKQLQHAFHDLEGLLQEDETYYFILQVTNQADLTSEGSANFTVMTSPPDAKAVGVSMPNVTSVSVGGVEVGVVENTDNLQVDLSVDPALEMEVEYFGELCY